jgi:hypothetical protein
MFEIGELPLYLSYAFGRQWRHTARTKRCIDLHLVRRNLTSQGCYLRGMVLVGLNEHYLQSQFASIFVSETPDALYYQGEVQFRSWPVEERIILISYKPFSTALS